MNIYVHPRAKTLQVVRHLERRTGGIAVIERNQVRIVQARARRLAAPQLASNDQPPFGGDAA